MDAPVLHVVAAQELDVVGKIFDGIRLLDGSLVRPCCCVLLRGFTWFLCLTRRVDERLCCVGRIERSLPL